MKATAEIVAFLQNPGFSKDTDPEVIKRYNHDHLFRRDTLKKYLTGQRILLSLGEELFDKIYWDNVILETGTLYKKTKPDMDHVLAVLEEKKPILVVTFGVVANRAITDCWDGNHLFCRHPNARGITRQELDDFARVVRQYADSIED